jgi:hypothetical protein
MGFPHTRWPQQDDVVGPLDEAQPRKFADLLAIDGGLKVEIKLIERLQPGQTSLLQAAFDALLIAAVPFRSNAAARKPL